MTRYRQPPSGMFVEDAVSQASLPIGTGTPNRVVRFQGTVGVDTTIPLDETPTAVAGLSACQISPGLPEGYHYDFKAGLFERTLLFTPPASLVVYLEYSLDAGVSWFQAQKHSLFQSPPVGHYLEVGNPNVDRVNPLTPGIITLVRLRCIAPDGHDHVVSAAQSWIRIEQYIT